MKAPASVTGYSDGTPEEPRFWRPNRANQSRRNLEHDFPMFAPVVTRPARPRWQQLSLAFDWTA